MSAAITYRGAGAPTAPGATTYKNAPLTNAEVDGNILSLSNAIDAVVSSVSSLTTTVSGKQATLVSGTNIKTVAGVTILGSGDVPFKTINSAAIQGSGDIALQTPLVSGTSIKTINSASVLGSGNIAVQTPLVSGTSIKTINGATLLASGDISLPTDTSTTTFTNKTVTGLKETRVAMPANDIAVGSGNVFTKTISGATTLTVSGVASAGTAVSFTLDLTNGGSAVITWWSGIKWANGAAPTLTTTGRDLLGFMTHDGGTTWAGFVIAKGLA